MLISPDEPIRCVHCEQWFPYKHIEDPEVHECAKDYEEEIAERKQLVEEAEDD